MAAEPSPDGALIMAQQGAPITRMPYDVLHSIFKSTKLGNAACLGLTCRALYRHLKEYNPSPLSLELCCCRDGRKYNQERYILCWISCFGHGCSRFQSLGVKILDSRLSRGYRLFDSNRIATALRLFNETIYTLDQPYVGRTATKEEEELIAVFMDFEEARPRTTLSRSHVTSTFERHRAGKIEASYLPWKTEELDAIRKDFHHHRHTNPEQWMEFWRNRRVVKDNMKEFETMMKEEILMIGNNGSA